MDLSLNEPQEMLRKMARDFFMDKCPKSLVREMVEDEKGYPPELWREMAGLEWMGLVIPEEHGGTGGNFLDLAVLLEEMGRACLPGPFFSTVVLGTLTLLEAGNEEQKKEILPGVAKGDLLLTLAFNEPDVRYIPEAIQLKATADGEDYLLDGVKLFVPDAHVASYIICAARTKEAPAPEGITLFLVDAKSPGISCTQLKTIAGDKQFEVIFDKVRVPKKNILGEVDKGWSCIEKILEQAAVAKCAEMVGGAQQVLEMTVSYAKERVQFGRPIGSFQAIQHHCANMATDVDGSRFITYQAAWRLSEGLPSAREVAMAKAWVSDAFRRVTVLGQQVHGGVGFVEDHDMPLYYKRAKAWELVLGDADYHREKVAQALEL